MIKVVYHPMVPVLQIACTLSFTGTLVAGALREDSLAIGALAFTLITGVLLAMYGNQIATVTDTDGG